MADRILAAILSQGSFDVTHVDRTSLRFGLWGPSAQGFGSAMRSRVEPVEG
jgi:hypothetical protein